jgi:hypothetical protein
MVRGGKRVSVLTGSHGRKSFLVKKMCKSVCVPVQVHGLDPFPKARKSVSQMHNARGFAHAAFVVYYCNNHYLCVLCFELE